MAAKITQENLGCWRLSCSLALSAHIPTCFLHVAYSPPCMYDIHSLQLSLNTQRLAWLRWGDTQILGSRWSAWYQVHLLYLPYRPCFPVHERKYHRKFRQCLGMLSQSLYRAEVAMGEVGPTGAGSLGEPRPIKQPLLTSILGLSLEGPLRRVLSGRGRCCE